MTYTQHYSVLKKEILEGLYQDQEGLFLDLTFGGGGHSLALLNAHSGNRVWAVDQDPDALTNAIEVQKRLDRPDRLLLLDMNFEDLPNWLRTQKMEEQIAGIVLDAGVSGHHFDCPQRGFSFRFDASLDMRMNPRAETPTAADLLNDLNQAELEKIFSEYGEERFARRIAQKVVEQRKISPLLKTKDLENLVFHCYPKNLRFSKIHPATRTFQALRIAVNRELEVLESVIKEMIPFLQPSGRFAVISFHSLEDRIVKNHFRDLAKVDKLVRIVTKKPILPSKEELDENSRSRSAKLRIVEKL